MPKMFQINQGEYLALTPDETPAFYGYTDSSTGHAVLVTEPALPGSDHIALELKNGTMRTVCNRRLDVSRLEHKYPPHICARCSRFASSEAAATAVADAVAADNAANNPSADTDQPAPAAPAPADVAELHTHAATLWAEEADKSATETADNDAEATEVADIKRRTAEALAESEARTALNPAKCAVTGRDKVKPVEGTVAEQSTVSGKPRKAGTAPGDITEEKGVCPVCRTLAPLTGKGFIASHRAGVSRVAEPASPGLSEERPKTTDTGARVGSPDAAEKARATEIAADAGRDRVTVTVKGKDHTVVGDADTYPAAIARAERRGDTALVKSLRKRFDIYTNRHTGKQHDGSKSATPSAPTVGARGESSIDGPALVRGAEIDNRRPSKSQRTTMDMPLGRERSDRKVVEIPKVGGQYGWLTGEEYESMSKSAKRRYWRNVASARKRAEIRAAKRRANATGHTKGASIERAGASVGDKRHH